MSEGYFRIRKPKKGEIFAVVIQFNGGSRLTVNCQDGKSRMARIPGKLKNKIRIKTGDVILIKPWSFQQEKADITWIYTRSQIRYLKRKHRVPKKILELIR